MKYTNINSNINIDANANTNTSIKTTLIVPLRSYPNADIQKREICVENKNKTGIYR